MAQSESIEVKQCIKCGGDLDPRSAVCPKCRANQIYGSRKMIGISLVAMVIFFIVMAYAGKISV